MKLQCADKIIDLSCPVVMGILNITPHSFAATGRFTDVAAAVAHGRQIYEEGAAIIDVGGEPTNPGVHPIVSLQQELDNILPVVEQLSRDLPIPISVDTSKPEVMREAIKCGASLINDVRALEYPQALEVIAETEVAVCLMHMAYPYGKPHANESDVLGSNPLWVIKEFLQQRVERCLNEGITHNRILIDPGVGHGSFGKNLQQNIRLIQDLSKFKSLNLPILVGLSRKTFIGELLDVPVEDRLYGSLAAAVIAVQNGANIIRCHDVKPTVQALKVASALHRAKLQTL